jgi:hypothetical protein
LLPDSFDLRAQHRNGPPINPATLQACASRYFGSQRPSGFPEIYDFWCFRKNGLRVHAPGAITRAEESDGRISFESQSWLEGPYFVLINGLAKKPQLRIDGKPVDCAEPHQFQEKEGRLILNLQGSPRIELKL